MNGELCQDGVLSHLIYMAAESDCSAQWRFLLNWPKISRINVAEHHPEICICSLSNK